MKEEGLAADKSAFAQFHLISTGFFPEDAQ